MRVCALTSIAIIYHWFEFDGSSIQSVGEYDVGSVGEALLFGILTPVRESLLRNHFARTQPAHRTAWVFVPLEDQHPKTGLSKQHGAGERIDAGTNDDDVVGMRLAAFVRLVSAGGFRRLSSA